MTTTTSDATVGDQASGSDALVSIAAIVVRSGVVSVVAAGKGNACTSPAGSASDGGAVNVNVDGAVHPTVDPCHVS